MASDLEQFQEAGLYQCRERVLQAIDDELGTLGRALMTHGGEHGLTIRPDGSFEHAAAPTTGEAPDPCH